MRGDNEPANWSLFVRREVSERHRHQHNFPLIRHRSNPRHPKDCPKNSDYCPPLPASRQNVRPSLLPQELSLGRRKETVHAGRDDRLKVLAAHISRLCVAWISPPRGNPGRSAGAKSPVPWAHAVGHQGSTLLARACIIITSEASLRKPLHEPVPMFHDGSF